MRRQTGMSAVSTVEWTSARERAAGVAVVITVSSYSLTTVNTDQVAVSMITKSRVIWVCFVIVHLAGRFFVLFCAFLCVVPGEPGPAILVW